MSPRSHSASRSPSPVPFEHVSLGAADRTAHRCRAAVLRKSFAESLPVFLAPLSILHSSTYSAAPVLYLLPSLDRHIFLGMMERWTREKKETGFVCHCNRFIETKWVCVYVVSLSHSLHESGPCSMSASLSLSSRFMQSSSSQSVTHSLHRTSAPVLPWPISHE